MAKVPTGKRTIARHKLISLITFKTEWINKTEVCNSKVQQLVSKQYFFVYFNLKKMIQSPTITIDSFNKNKFYIFI